MIAEDYKTFIAKKSQATRDAGFDPVFMPSCMKDFQKHLANWNCVKGRSATLADCGLGKTLIELVWGFNCYKHTGKPTLQLAPLAVSHQTVREGEKFNIDCAVSRDGKLTAPVVVTNYERLHHFNPDDFGAVTCDEASILKNFDGATKAAVTEFMRPIPYRLLATATAAPNDYHELGTASEALGYLGYTDMITRFFKEDVVKDYLGWGRKTYRFRGHAEQPFWKWVCSWSRSCRKPSDLGFDDSEFILPELEEKEIIVKCSTPREGMLFAMPAGNLHEQRDERRATLDDRCQIAAETVSNHDGSSVVWCHLNDEADRLEEIIPDSKQVSGTMDDDEKEEILAEFQSGKLKQIIIKPRIGCLGLNWQHCSNVVTFASHSWEQYYQSVRRCWRFGQKNKVKVSIITSEGEARVLANLKRKASQAEEMFSSLVRHMNAAIAIDGSRKFKTKEERPSWLTTKC